jgi:hypothetical protein
LEGVVSVELIIESSKESASERVRVLFLGLLYCILVVEENEFFVCSWTVVLAEAERRETATSLCFVYLDRLTVLRRISSDPMMLEAEQFYSFLY